MSYTMEDGTYTYKVQTWTKLTVTPSRINNYLSDIYTPTITRTTAGGTVTRYFTFIVTSGTHDVTLTQYKAAFTSSSKTATVTVQSNTYKLGRIANQRAINQALVNQINVQLRTSASGNVITTAGGASYTLAFSGFTPDTPTINYSTAQTTPSAEQFGLIKGFASASWSASVAAKTWTFTDTSMQTINPAQTLSLSANGATASSGSRTDPIAWATLEAKLVNATSLTGTATVTNVLGGSASTTKTLTVQDYIKPSLSALAVSRDSNNHAVITFNWSVAGVNEANTAANPCTSGTVTATWSAVDNGTSPTTWSGTKTIIADGAVMSGTTDSCTITETAHTYDPDKSYTIAITITDRLGQSSATVTTILSSEFRTIDFLAGGKGVAIGKTATHEAFDVAMPMYLQDTPVADWVTEQGTNGSWKYRKWSNGRFEAIFHSSAGSTGSMTQLGSSGIYYSAVSAVTFPSAIGIASIDYCSAVCSPPSNYFMMMITNRLSTSSVYIGYIRFGSGSAVSNVDYSVKVEGTWA